MMTNVKLIADRKHGVFRSALGQTIHRALDDPQVVEVMANADGRVWTDRIGEGRVCIGTIEFNRAEAIIRLIADHIGEEAGKNNPTVSGTLPKTGERFQGQLPPITEAPVFAIRKRPAVIYSLDDYVRQSIMTKKQAEVLRQAICDRLNILVAGGTGSGKTTLANAILAQPTFAQDRVLIIEDTRELQCSSQDCVELLTKKTQPVVTMNDLVRHALRLRPDRIIVGEVRGGEALSMIKAWNTGHPGGLATVHANSAEDALSRIEDLIGEVVQNVPRRSIARSINLVVFIERTESGRMVRSICRVAGYDEQRYLTEEI